MNTEDLKKQFFVDDDVLKARLEALVSKAQKYCKIDKQGQVMIIDTALSRKDQVMLTLAARSIAAQLDPKISADVNISDIARSTGLAPNQVRARGNEFVKNRIAESPERGIYRATPHKIEAFLDSLSPDLSNKK
jgi:hypothetical protein